MLKTILIYILSEVDYLILKFSIYELFRNLSSLADWLSAIGTVSAVMVALYQIRNDKRQDLSDNRPEIMLNIKKHGIYSWYNRKNNGLSRNTFILGNFGKASNLSIHLTVSKDKEKIKDWLQHNKLYKIRSSVKKLPEFSNYKVEFQDFLFGTEKAELWFPREYKRFFVTVVCNIQTQRFLDSDLSTLNNNFPVFTYKIQYDYRGKRVESFIKVKPKFKFYNDSDQKRKMIKLTFYIYNHIQ